MLDNVLVSIVIPVYNTKAEFIKECIESIVDIKYPHEIIVVDDGSYEKDIGICNGSGSDVGPGGLRRFGRIRSGKLGGGQRVRVLRVAGDEQAARREPDYVTSP